MNPFILAVLAAIFFGSAPIFEKIGLAKIDPLIGIFYRSFFVALILIIYFGWKGELTGLFSFPASSILCLITGGLLSALVGQWFYFTALKSGEASKIVPISGSYPMIAMILALLILGEEFTFSKLFGVIFILTGIVLLR